MKIVATALLVAVAVVFFVARWQEEQHSWVGFIRAFAEASMVGALADWFAVSALFRHPLGIPIPHTAIIPNRKDQIGRSLGDFVQTVRIVRGRPRTPDATEQAENRRAASARLRVVERIADAPRRGTVG